MSIVKDAAQEVLRLPLLGQSEAEDLLEGFNPILDDDSVPQTCLHHLFEAQADHQPHAPCIRAPQEVITYGEVEQRANALAHLLQRRGVGVGQAVGVMLDRGPDLYIAILAVLKAGAAYLPMDSGYPDDRLKFMASDAGIQVLVTSKNLAKIVDGTDIKVRPDAAFKHISPGMLMCGVHIKCSPVTRCSTAHAQYWAIDQPCQGRCILGNSPLCSYSTILTEWH